MAYVGHMFPSVFCVRLAKPRAHMCSHTAQVVHAMDVCARADASDVTASGDAQRLQANALVAFSAYSLRVRSGILPHLPAVVPAILARARACLAVFTAQLDDGEGDDDGVSHDPTTSVWANNHHPVTQLLQAALSAISVLVETTPQFLGPYIKDIIAMVTSPVLQAARLHVEAADVMTVCGTTDAIASMIAATIPARILLPAVYGTCTSVLHIGATDNDAAQVCSCG